MNILFIWNATISPLYEWRNKCIRRALEVYPDAKFKVITQLTEFFGIEIVSLHEVVRHMEEYNIRLDNTVMFANYARLYWLARHANTLYIDTDTFCIKPIKQSPTIQYANDWAIWNGQELESIQDVLDQHGGKEILLPTPELLPAKGKSMIEYFDHKPAWRKLIYPKYPSAI
jgi:hypothetical protein